MKQEEKEGEGGRAETGTANIRTRCDNDAEMIRSGNLSNHK